MLASIIFDDFFEVGETLLKADPQVQKLCKDFGIDSMDSVAIDPWPSASPVHPCLPCRLFQHPVLRDTVSLSVAWHVVNKILQELGPCIAIRLPWCKVFSSTTSQHCSEHREK